jgi:hypothetical protein
MATVLNPFGTMEVAKMILIWYEFTNYLNFERVGVTQWLSVGDHRVGAHQDHRVRDHRDHPV